MTRTLAIHGLSLAVLLVSAVSAGAAELLMFRKDGCPWCAAWEREVGEVYPRTAESRRAPLRRVDLDAPSPDGVLLDGRIAFTPTFVLVEDGREVGRITGYPGEAFFWARLEELLNTLDEQTHREDPS